MGRPCESFRRALAEKNPALPVLIRKDEMKIPCYHLYSQTARAACLSKCLTALGNVTVAPVAAYCLRPIVRFAGGMPETGAGPKFGARLGDVFGSGFVCTSHQPVTFCTFHLKLLVPVIAVGFFNMPIIDAEGRVCQWVFINLFTAAAAGRPPRRPAPYTSRRKWAGRRRGGRGLRWQSPAPASVHGGRRPRR